MDVRVLIALLLFIISCSCSTSQKYSGASPKVSIDTVLVDKISIRALAVQGSRLWYSADKGRVGYYETKTGKRSERIITSDSLSLEFRSIASNNKDIFILNAGTPALLYRIDPINLEPTLVYTEKGPKVFYDSMQFRNSNEGMAIGDPTEACLSVIITNDGGKSWKKLSCDRLPQTADGEAAFAASNTNLIVKDSKSWIVSGGKKSRIFYSPDKGWTWLAYETPLVQGREMTGAFTGDFYNDQIGFIAGGDYEKPKLNSKNKAFTQDGGKSWTSIADNNGFGYASCVQFIPGGRGRKLVSVGATGLWYSGDGGASWQMLSNDDSLFTIRFFDAKTAFAAGRNKIVRIRLD